VMLYLEPAMALSASARDTVAGSNTKKAVRTGMSTKHCDDRDRGVVTNHLAATMVVASGITGFTLPA